MLKRKPQASDTPIKRSIAVISDLHFGSIYAPQPDAYKTHDSRFLVPSMEQRYLNSVFSWCKGIMNYWKADSIIFTGDLIQGLNKKGYGRDNVTSDLEEQQDMAIQYLKPICKKRQISGVSGTPYHKSSDTEVERDIIEALGGQFLGKMAWIKIKDSDRILNVAHEGALSSRFPVGALEREAHELLKAYARGKAPKPDIIIRGHRHLFAHIHTPYYHAIAVPAFQTWTPFKTTYYGATLPDIGIAMLFIDKKDRVICHHYTKPPVQIGDKTYAI